jgi:protein-disulfide isomerase
MRFRRRPFLAALAAGTLAPAALRAQDPPAGGAAAEELRARDPQPEEQPAPPQRPGAPAPDPRLTERAIGSAEAPVTVKEFFSLTCSHCAAFHRDTWPQVRRDLVETGQLRWIWRDFPLDRVALLGAMVARSLPPERYEGFIGTLLKSQDRWAFARDPVEELARLAALAGMDRARFDAVQRDEALARGILEGRAAAESEYRIQATPSFAFRGRTAARPVMHSGNLGFDRFRALVEEARRA